MESSSRLRIAVVISGNGSNLQAIIDASRRDLAVDIAVVISNRPDAYGLRRATSAGIDTLVIDHDAYRERQAFDNALMAALDRYQPQLVVLAGFMRVLSDDFVGHYRGRLLNIHPSLLPKYRGLNTHARALRAGDREHGASVHFVTETLDGGPVIVQARLPILANDTVDSLSQRVQQLEHQIYVEALRWYADGRLRWQDDCAMLDGRPLTEPRMFEHEDIAKT